MRGWTWIGGESRFAPEVEEQIATMLNGLAERWSRLERSIERRSFVENGQIDEEMMEDRREFERDRAYNQAIKAGKSEEEAREEGEDAASAVLSPLEEADDRDIREQQAIETTMRELGARMMRPYEHWNEEERYMEWSENRYDDSRDYY